MIYPGIDCCQRESFHIPILQWDCFSIVQLPNMNIFSNIKAFADCDCMSIYLIICLTFPNPFFPFFLFSFFSSLPLLFSLVHLLFIYYYFL